MKKLIIITGDLASGKSSLADSLSLKLAIPCFKKDTIKEKYVDMYGFKNREENRQLTIKAVDYMIEAFEKFAKNNADLILEANFRGDELKRIKDIALQYQYDVTLLVLRGDIEELYERFLKRIPTRHKAHMSMHLDESIDKFKEYVLSQREEELCFIPHIIDTTGKNEEEVLKRVVAIYK